VVAGLGHYLFSEMLLEVANFFEIPPPEFRGKMEYKEHGTEKWLIQTTIQGRHDEPEDPTMQYTKAYVDWDHSVEIAMQGAIAHICHKYHDNIPMTSGLYYFGEHIEEGNAIDRRGEEAHSYCRTYFTERDHSIVRLENMLKKQISIMDSFRNLFKEVNLRLQQKEALILWLDGKKTAFEERIKVLEEPQKLEEELLCSNNWAHVLEKTVLLQCKNLHNYKEEKDQLRKENGELKMENKELKKKIAEFESKAQEEEDPEKLTLYNTDGEDITVDECEARAVRKVKEAREARK
jgi:regulator of replication initiation timing